MPVLSDFNLEVLFSDISVYIEVLLFLFMIGLSVDGRPIGVSLVGGVFFRITLVHHATFFH